MKSFASSYPLSNTGSTSTDIPFTTWIGAEDRAILRRHATTREIAAGEILWREGAIDDRIVIVLGGRIKLLKETGLSGSPVVLALFGPGALICDDSFASGQPRFTSAAAQEESQLLLLSRGDFEHLSADHPLLANKLLGEALISISGQLRHAHLRLAAIF